MKIVKQTYSISKADQELASRSYKILRSELSRVEEPAAELSFLNSDDKMDLPLSALRLLEYILKEIGAGNELAVISTDKVLSTQEAADLLNCSRPHLVKLVESGQLPFSKVGKHRRIRLRDLLDYKQAAKEKQEKLIRQLMQTDEETGLYGE